MPDSQTRAILVSVVVLSILSAPAVYAGATTNTYSSNGGAQATNDKNSADITVTFSDDCTDFHVESSKEISFVSVNYEDDFSYRKFEGSEIRHEDEDTDGDDPKGKNLQDFSRSDDKPIKSIVVKSGSTKQVFDCPEGGSGEAPGSNEPPECSDGNDNDRDGKTDHPDDDGCETPDDDDERPPADGGNGGTEGPPGDETCSDGEDNDGDGKVDQEDEDCREPEGPQGDETCSDGVDNDGDSKVDQEDEDCNEGAQDGKFCDDGDDNDGDGKVDGDDEDCPTEPTDPECTGQGEPIAVSAAGNDIVGTEGPNDDNAIDANVQSGSDAQSDCDTVDADAGTHSSNAGADDDSIDADVGSNASAISDDDSIDVDVASQEHCRSDNNDIEVSVPPSADCTTPTSSNAATNVFAGVLNSVHKVFGTLFVG